MSRSSCIARICAAADVAIISGRGFQVKAPQFRLFEAAFRPLTLAFDVADYYGNRYYFDRSPEDVRELLHSTAALQSNRMLAACQVYAQKRGGLLYGE